MKTRLLLTTVLAVGMAGIGASYVMGAVGVDSGGLRAAVNVPGMRSHQAALQAIADANNGTRASGTPGYRASIDYVKTTLTNAGYSVTEQEFDFPYFQELAPATFAQVTPNAVSYIEPDDFSVMEYSGSGDVTAPVQNAGGFVLPATPEPSSASGCTAADFAGFTAGTVALVQRGSCTFAEKALNAQGAGAVAVIIFNEGNPGRTDNFGGTLGGLGVNIPVISTSYAIGSTLAGQSSPIVHITTSTKSEILTTWNLITETTGGRSDRVVAVGAHLDSVPGGAGIEDNGSGSSAILEIALQMKAQNVVPKNKVRFMWFGAEEAGLLGSEYYVSQLTKRQKQDIMLNLNFDMIASPNYVRFVYDGDGSDTGTSGPNGSSVIEDVFAKYFKKVAKLPFEATAFDGRSDYGPFIDAGIPAGGLFTGAEELKTAEQVAIYGGTLGEQLDPCYHAACDDYGNNNEEVFEQMGDAAADAVLQFAMTTSAVKGTSKAADAAVKSVKSESLLYRGSHLQK
jgi:Zn-dependent M28 family amino/carboxypeptidase